MVEAAGSCKVKQKRNSQALTTQRRRISIVNASPDNKNIEERTRNSYWKLEYHRTDPSQKLDYFVFLTCRVLTTSFAKKILKINQLSLSLYYTVIGRRSHLFENKNAAI